MQHFHKTTHVSPFVVVRQIDIHIYRSNRMLNVIFSIKYGYGISQVFYPNLVNGDIAMIELVLNIFHFGI